MVTGIHGNSNPAPDLQALRQARFKKTDADGDGKITKDELKAALPENGQGPDAEKIFSKVDTNQDGAIDETEDTAAAEKMHDAHRPPGGPQPSKMASKLFEKADANADGKIGKEELTEALPSSAQTSTVDKLFKLADSDEDGSLTESELEDALQKLMEENQSDFLLLLKPPVDSYNQSGQGTTSADGGLLSASA